MTIAFGEIVQPDDVDDLTTYMLAIMRGVATGTRQWPLNFVFSGITASTPAYARKVFFVSPADALIETVHLFGSELDIGSTATLTLEGEAVEHTVPLMFPVSMSLTANGSQYGFGTRALMRGGAARVDAAYLPVSPVPRTLMQGAGYLLSVSTTNTNATGQLQGALILRQAWGRV